MIEDCVIVGGGVAGLSAANTLADRGLSPLIIESGKFPAHRICGEFISHECLPILQRWDIPVSQAITGCRFYSGQNKVELEFPYPSGSCSRYLLDSSLLERAKQKGARALTETSVLSLNIQSENYELVLSNGQMIKARHLMIGTGRIPKMPGMQEVKELKYFGFKSHFKGIHSNQDVEIHNFKGGYLGISNVDSETTNIACIVHKNLVENPALFMEKLIQDESLPFFKERMLNAEMLFPNWLTGQVPEFGIRDNPSWDRVFWIGDAAGSIPPVSGNGLAIAITSGHMAANFYLDSNAAEFKKAWLARYKKRFFIAKCLHRLMIHPQISPIAIKLGSKLPWLPHYIWKLTRES
jgi:flavin-dependent dehydrogenase